MNGARRRDRESALKKGSGGQRRECMRARGKATRVESVDIRGIYGRCKEGGTGSLTEKPASSDRIEAK